ncbi:membrane protein insertase, YidC/Oxa1 family [Campylobacter corcagiensis]|uniref:Membrane protein insertase YidC n=2 Tax=Campylobacter corcagiensis TaxID=1448857 RepID=A0A7M1LDV5_9BACT|nr:membrane protein insertase YidC [Campylobacter corcagiensis]QKF65092.1 membrane protein insertase, YidC/Oxa1 family [Campylobacter corcagiensis]QOQ86762.1 membrane protein insertase YidC [Campylobacter corcagiensis]
MIDDNSMQKRAILAIVLTLLFFLGYDYFYLSKFKDTNQTVTSSQYDAPVAKSNVSKKAPVEEQKSVITTINSRYFKATIDELGRFNSFVLNDRIYVDKEGKQLDLIGVNASPLPLEIRFSDQEINKKAFEVPYVANSANLDLTSGDQTVVLTQDLGEVIVKKTITISQKGNYKLDVSLNKDLEYFISSGMRPDILADRMAINGTLLREAEDKSLEVIKDGKVDKGGEVYNDIDIISSFDRYYATVFYSFNSPLNVILNENSNANQVFVSASGDFSVNGFIGPKNKELLKSIDPELIDIIEYGFFTFLAKPMFSFLSYLYNLTGNWGWAIVLMTIIIRLFLAPLTIRGMVSMNKLKDVAPKIKEIQEKYKDNPQKMQQKVMELYRQSGANPMGGCLPILLQIPVFFAVYRVLVNAIELQGAPWILWIDNLADKDPYFILPIIMIFSMWLQQKMTNATFQDPMQEKIMKAMPFIFGIFMAFFAAGLTLYWATNNLLSVLQQAVINRIIKKKKEAEEIKKADKEVLK